MRKPVALWLLCLSLVVTRLIGLHLHACGCPEDGAPPAGMYYADNGLVFGEHHDANDQHDVDVDVDLSATAKYKVVFDDGLALPASVVAVVAAQRVISLVSARGPPVVPRHRPYAFSPPPRGPPRSPA